MKHIMLFLCYLAAFWCVVGIVKIDGGVFWGIVPSVLGGICLVAADVIRNEE